jgi:hypothetical protein
MIRKAKAVWRGTGRNGSGNLSTDSDVLDNMPDAWGGTRPSTMQAMSPSP